MFPGYFAEGCGRLDAGCGSGRWAAQVAPRVGHLHCVDASADALGVARQNLIGVGNVSTHEAPSMACRSPMAAWISAIASGVLHHLPDPQAGLIACVKALKPGVPMLVYIYYALDGRPAWFRLLWHISNVFRGAVSRTPFWFKSAVAEIVAALVYWPLACAARLVERLGFDVANSPLSEYRWRSFYSMRNDALDRLGTRIEHRMTRAQIGLLMERAGLSEIRFSKSAPFWCAVGRKI